MTDKDLSANFQMGQRYGNHPQDGKYPGRLIIVEGIDGSGKSTQIDLLDKWLQTLNLVTVFTEWNSSPIVRGTTKRGKDQRMLTPMSFSLIHAADFASRVVTQILPALKSGTIVLADRYVYTAFARDGARGVNKDWLRRLYAFAIRPSLALYFRVPLDESIRRIVTGRAELGFYESGQDVKPNSRRESAFRDFQGSILEEYDKLTEEFGLVTIDATLPIHDQQRMVRDLVEPMLPGVMQLRGQDVAEVLSTSGLTGRYITKSGSRRVPELLAAPDG
jgi:dTMP kinase